MAVNETSSEGVAATYKAYHHICVTDVGAKFSKKEIITSAGFFCRDDPQPVILEMELRFGFDPVDKLSGYVRSLTRVITFTKLCFHILDKDGIRQGGKDTGGVKHVSDQQMPHYGWKSLHGRVDD